jgi:hypothetical protein
MLHVIGGAAGPINDGEPLRRWGWYGLACAGARAQRHHEEKESNPSHLMGSFLLTPVLMP